jgi:HTH-type transcriptional regulator/antitoxin HigA
MESQAFSSPGDLIRSLLTQLGWTQGVLASVLGIGQSAVSRILADKRPIDAAMALRLGEALSTPPEVFLNAQVAHDLARARSLMTPDPKRAARARALANFPVPEMIARGWINADVRELDRVEAELLRFFGARSLDELPAIEHAAKKTDADTDATPAQLAWLQRVRTIASEMIPSRYSPTGVRGAVAQLAELRASATGAHQTPGILSEAGIRFVIVESLASAKIDGTCFWLNDLAPVIGMSMRFDRIDNFWFVLRHEIEHVLRGHGRTRPMIDAELEGERAGTGGGITEAERIANEAAVDFCVPQTEMDKFYAKKSPFFVERDILGFAATVRVHPGLVVGQLQHRTGRFDRLRTHLVKVRDVVTPSAAVDGWGNVYPVDN